MQTLYDILGLGLRATPEQIDHAYKLHLQSITSPGNDASLEQNTIRAKAVNEAYSILSSPSRRANYDAKLTPKQEQLTPHIVESSPFPWLKISLIILLMLGGLLYYNQQQHKAEMERKALEAKQAQAEAEQAEQVALAEQAREQQAKLSAQQQQDSRQAYEIERGRQEGQYITQRNLRFDDQVARDKRRDELQAAADKIRSEREAKQRRDAQTAALSRALAIPIYRH